MAVFDLLVDLVRMILLVHYYILESVVLFFVPAAFRRRSLEEELVLVTGAGSGIGRLQAVMFAEAGCNVVLWDINSKGIEETAKLVRQTGQKAWYYVCDVSKREKVYEVAAKVKREAGRVTVLVNNAGIVAGGMFVDLPDEAIERTIAVNAMAHVWTLKAFLPDMMRYNHGHIVTIASIMGEVSAVGMSEYVMSKFAAVGFHDTMVREMRASGKDGINFTLVNPYMISTGMFEGAKIRYDAIMPTLEPEYVARRVVDAVQTGTTLIRTPSLLHSVVFLKSLLPQKAIFAMEDFFQTERAMENFVGRKNIKTS